ncbi:hypothetical protein CLV59_1011008 [Chitinophaga dinghuensis]|uniref:Uncharacterized protein n=1 Tax=Chitinophaga dinghuensis TaxID=1539050 RepID=A0A327WFY2_9BACT|nr:hypothetical protein [Chitinophaga dinghuensis]RAJ88240.1 hypothetical protein CLV59_1011008 [Chitinophaga dinghuensis]
MTPEIYFHEDDLNQVEIIPEQNYANTVEQMEGFPPQEEGVMGFTSIIIRDQTPVNISELKISAAALNSALTPQCTQVFGTVKTGYGSYVEIVEHAAAYGFDKYAIVVESLDDVVKNIFLIDYYPPKEIICKPIFPVLYQLGTQFPLILVDWNACSIVRLNNETAINEYLEYIFNPEE